MKSHVISVDQSTSSTKAFLFDESGSLINEVCFPHRQFYPFQGWVEHDATEIFENTVKAIREVISNDGQRYDYSIAITNQRETVVVWDIRTGKPVCNAVVWQCMRGLQICNDLKNKGFGQLVQERTGLIIDPYFSGSGVKWILDNIPGAGQDAIDGFLRMGTIDSWLIWKLTRGKSHATDYTNASRTMLFNIHTLDWDDDLLKMLGIPRSMLPKVLPCDSIFGSTDVEGTFDNPIPIAGVLGDSHGALVGQMCFSEGLGKVTYGTGSSVMVNIGETPALAPSGLVTSIGYSALGKVFYAYEGNIHCSGATLSWLVNQLGIISSPEEAETLANEVSDNGGVYLVPAFAGLGAPWWHSEAKAQISGLTLGSGKKHICRAALESIAYQVTDLISAMVSRAGIELKEIRVDGGPTKNHFLMHFQSDILQVPVVSSDIKDASAFGAFIVNGFARKKWFSFEEAKAIWKFSEKFAPNPSTSKLQESYNGWRSAIDHIIKH